MRKDGDSQGMKWLFGLAAFLMVGLFVGDIVASAWMAMPMLYPTVVLMAGLLPGKKPLLIVAVTTSVLAIAGLVPSRPDGVRLLLVANHLLALGGIWVTTGLLLLQKQREEKLGRLTGLLPMCSLCKKIRDDRGLWSQIEQYFEDHHADLQFTHGLCPACSRQLYPGLFARLSAQSPEVSKEAR
jgi:hypothetical protein